MEITVRKVTPSCVVFDSEPFGKWVHAIWMFEYKCYRMLKTVHGKEFADKEFSKFVAKRILEEDEDRNQVPPQPDDYGDVNVDNFFTPML